MQISAFAKVNVIKSSNSSDDSSIVLQVGTENIQLKEFKSIFYKNNNEETITKEYLDEYIQLFIDFKRKVFSQRKIKWIHP